MSDTPATLNAFSLEEVRRCTEILHAIVKNRDLLADVPVEERRKLLTAAGRMSRPTSPEERTLSRAFRRGERRKTRQHDRSVIKGTEIRAARENAVFVAPQLSAPAQPQTERELKVPKNCYVCKQPYTRLHFFYDSMCPACATFNYAKRHQTAPLDGRVALITGSRVKIGFHAALKVLRAGGSVITTTRFPHDAALRFSREEDFNLWGSRLKIFGLDLRHAPSVEIFARYMNQTCERLDLLINNAAQTVRRPPGFYAHLLAGEVQPLQALPAAAQELLRDYEICKTAVERSSGILPASSEHAGRLPALPAEWNGIASGLAAGLRTPAQLSQLQYEMEEHLGSAELFPAGRTDADLQQIDLRTQNSWRMTLAEVPTPELLEVQLVNAVAPFILCSRLKPLMMRHRTGEKHIVNVSAMEGIFSRGTKTDKHPHTNMAKAALNMMTLTSAPDFARDGIFMNAVDTGWVTDEDPIQHAERKKSELDFQPPLDIVDGAARICDPFFAGLLSGVHLSGKFLKDYMPSNW